MKTIRSDFQWSKFSWQSEGYLLPTQATRISWDLSSHLQFSGYSIDMQEDSQHKKSNYLITSEQMVGSDFWQAPVTYGSAWMALGADPQLSCSQHRRRVFNAQDGGKEEKKVLKYLWSLAPSQGSLAISGQREV